MVGKIDQTLSSQLYKRLSILRWLVLAFGIFMALLHQFLQGSFRTGELPRWEVIELVYAVAISVVAWAVLTWLRRSVGQTETAERALNQTLIELSQANQRLEFLLQVNRRLSEAEDRQTLSDIILDLFMGVAPAAACSLICFDAQQRTLPVAYRSKGSVTAFDNQVPHFSATEARQQCQACNQRGSKSAHACTLFIPPLPDSTVKKTHCLELARATRYMASSPFTWRMLPIPTIRSRCC
jgi:hypothetical protein